MLFVAQAGLVLLFGGGGRGAAKPAFAPVQFRLLGNPMTADQLSKMFFAVDPAVFPQPSRHGFSGRAWLNSPPPEFDVPDEKEPPAWLALDTARLGTDFPSLNRVKAPMPFGLTEDRGTEPEPWPVFLTPELFRTQSVFQVQGALAGRQLSAPPALRSWPSAQLLRQSVVQIAVDPAGQVIATRLLGRSGLTDADTNALGVARSLRFRPTLSPNPVWGQAVFAWQTAEPTNSSPPAAP